MDRTAEFRALVAASSSHNGRAHGVSRVVGGGGVPSSTSRGAATIGGLGVKGSGGDSHLHSNGNGNGSKGGGSGPGNVSDGVLLTRAASSIMRQVTGCSSKLQRLTRLVQSADSTAVFSDPRREIHALTSSIQSDLQNLNQRLDKLESLRNARRGGRSQPQRPKSGGLDGHVTSMVRSLKTRILTATKTFKNALETRNSSLKGQQQRKGDYRLISSHGASPGSNSTSQSGDAPSPSPAPSSVSSPSPSPSPSSVNPYRRRRGRKRQQRAGGWQAQQQLDQNEGGELKGHGASNASPGQSQTQAMSMVAAPSSYLAQRADAVQEIEGRIAELGTIFHRLASLVSEQGESVTRIDDELTDTLSNIEAGHGELVRYYEGLSSGRLLMMKVIGVLMTFALIFLFFFS